MRVSLLSFRGLVAVAAVCLAFSLVGSANAQITFIGSVNPSDPGDNDLETTLEVGEGNDATEVDPRGTVIVNNDSLEFDEARIGNDEGFFGRMFVSGIAGRFNVESSGANGDPALQVGRDGNGYLEISGEAILEMEDDAGDAVIGDRATSVGRMVVTDPFTFVSIGENFQIGNEGIGELEVLSGAIVRTRDSTGAAVSIGVAANGVGSVWVDGAGSVLQPADDLTVGSLGTATLRISNGGLVDADSSANLTTVGVLGRIELDGGTLAVDNLTSSGVIAGHGLVRGDGAGTGVVTSGVTARIEAGSGQLLQFNDDVVNQGSINIEGGEIEFLDSLANNAIGASTAPGRITLEDGRVRFTQGLTNNGVITAAEGASDLHGAISNEATGAVTVARDAVATFHDPFTDNGGTLTILTGATGLFLADLTFTGNSTLILELDEEASAGSPALSVSGTADLAGELRVGLPDGFTPEPGQTFTLLQASDVTGAFIPPLLPNTENGLELELESTSTSVFLNVLAPSLPGDFNGDGSVDAADYTVWRDGLGTEFVQNDYNVWAANFGSTSATSSGGDSGTPVPEPSGLLLIALGVPAFLACRRF